MAMRAHHLKYGHRAADKIAERDRLEAQQQTLENRAVDGLSESFGLAGSSHCEELQRMKRGELDPSIAMRLIEAREAGAREQRRQKALEKLDPK